MEIMAKIRKTLSFSHLAGIGKYRAEAEDKPEDEKKKDEGERDHEDGNAKKQSKRDQWAKKAEEDDERKQLEDESDEDYEARMEKMDEEEDEEEDEEKEKKEGKKAKKAEEEDDDKKEEDDKDVEMYGSSPVVEARNRERRRCAAIFACKAAGKNPALAANLAFNTRMKRSEAIAVLEGTPAPQRYGIGRESRNPNVGPGMNGSITTKQAVDKSWDVAFAKANGHRK